MVSFVDVVKGQAVSLANQGFKKVAGNLRGAVGSALNRGEVTASETTRPKGDPKAYTFPLDVRNPDQGLGNHGHYILFHINEQTNAKISFGEKGSSDGWGGLTEASAQQGGRPANDLVSDLDYAAFRADNPNFDFNADGVMTIRISDGTPITADERSTVKVKTKPTTKVITSIALYMPPTVNVTYTANYNDTEIGSGAAAAQQFLDASSFSEVRNIAASDQLNRDLLDGLQKATLGTVGAVPGFQGARELYEKEQGYIFTNRLELAFKGLPKRGFQYTFKMIPKSEQEANAVKNIVDAFKINMLPEGMGDHGTFTGKNLKIPNTFDIKYMFVGIENSYLNKISTCVLESLNVSYGGDRYKTFDGNSDGAPPVETAITLNFKEMELITKEKALEGF